MERNQLTLGFLQDSGGTRLQLLPCGTPGVLGLTGSLALAAVLAVYHLADALPHALALAGGRVLGAVLAVEGLADALPHALVGLRLCLLRLCSLLVRPCRREGRETSSEAVLSSRGFHVSINPSFSHVTLKEEGGDPLEHICHLSCATLG